MSLALDRIDSAPIISQDLDPQFLQWIWVLIDTLNENLSDLESAVSSTFAVPGAAQFVSINSIYIATNAGGTIFQLPAIAPVGARVEIDGLGAGGWQLLTSAGQTIKVASVGGSASTSVTSTSRYDSIGIVCVVANTTWITVTSQTAGFVII